MKLRAWRSAALLSALFAALLGAATRPRYGGTLRIQLAEAPAALDPADPAAGRIQNLVFETLVRLDDHGQPRAHLASGWQHDDGFKRWRIFIRAGIAFHDGTPLTAPSVAEALTGHVQGAAVSVVQQSVVVRSETPRPGLLLELADPRTAILRRNPEGVLAGTGPFQLKQWDAQNRTLIANEDYWGSRPYLDGITFTNVNPDVMEVPVGAPRRPLAERFRLWASAPNELLVIRANDVAPVVGQALSLSIDRAAIATVIAQRRGEPAGALLPQWLTGHAFLFNAAPDLNQARQLLSTVRLMPLTLSYPAPDTLARAVAERIAVNARDAGISVQVSSRAANPHLRLIRVRINSLDGGEAIEKTAGVLGLELPSDAAASLYDRERALLQDSRAIPLLHVPDVFALHPRVRAWEDAHGSRDGRLHLEDVWIEP